ncbi:MAG: hypothetical protein EPGJADBJ_05530 [Saprospiraceae bacterium]|nr:hypothetical protein [Saprospiraceae bacterium]
MRTFTTSLLLLSTFGIRAQLYDNTWLMGYQSGPVEPGDNYGITILRFNDGTATVEDNSVASIEFTHNNSSFSDSLGSLLVYCNGLQIEDASYHIMQNGEELNKQISLYQNYSDDTSPQGSIFLPWPNHPDSILLIYAGDLFIPGLGTSNRNLSYAVIDGKANNGLGKVVAREQPILEDTIVKGQLTSVKHANGRDWWIMIHEENTNRFYRILIDPQGVHVLGQQLVDFPMIDGLGQSCFSPDGRFFVVYNAINASSGSFLDVFDFDRCSGMLYPAESGLRKTTIVRQCES